MSMIKIMVLTILITLFVTGPVLANEDKDSQSAQITCPVMGGKINKEVYTDYKGNRVYFCCKSCIGEFNKDPDKYINDLSKAGVTLEKVPTQGSPKNSVSRNDTGDSADSPCSGCGGCSQ